MHLLLEPFQGFTDTLADLGEFARPEMMRTMTRIMISSEMPIVPNM